MLSKFLQNESQLDFAERIGLSRQTVQKLYSNQATRIEFATIEKICKGLGIEIGELLVQEETEIEQALRHAHEITIVLGARLVKLLGESAPLTYGIGPDDVDALSHITEAMTRLSKERHEIKRYWFPEWPEWNEPQNQDCEERAQHILRYTQGVLFIVGSDLTNGFTHYCLDKILDVGYDPRGKTRKPKRMELPYKMAWGHEEKKPRIMSLDQEKHEPRGIWSIAQKKLVVEVPSRETVTELQPGDVATDGAIVYVDRPNFHHPGCTVVGIAGFGGKGTALMSKHLFKEEYLRLIDRQLQEADGMPNPIFLVAQVDYIKGGSEDKLKFIS